jgi:peptidoglycan/LPS O-acetylase OafA/YrhL
MNRLYFPNLNGLRFFAALSVMVYHFFGEEVLNGHFGVTLFFVLSGFLITYLLFEEVERKNTISIRNFYFRRVLRIWPLYYTIILISTIIYFTLNNSVEHYIKTIPLFIFFLPNLAMSANIAIPFMGILWSVGSEEQFYLIWPWIIKKTRLRTSLGIFISLILFFSISPHLIDYANYHFWGRLSEIKILTEFLGRLGFGSMATGAVMAFLAKYEPQKLSLIFSWPVQISTFLAVCFLWIGGILPHMAISDQILASLFAILIVNFAINKNVLVSLENPLLSYLGKISFGLYVYHLMAFALTYYFFENFIPNKIIMFILGLCSTILFASLSYYLLEKPFLTIKAKKYTVIQSGK